MFVSDGKFRVVLSATPLVSIDLLIVNHDKKVLVGLRKNRPAQDFWFVPGGRILKGESISVAFQRLTHTELGQTFTLEQSYLLGAFDHFYTDSVYGTEPSTHYVALGYKLHVTELNNLPSQQHTCYRWLCIPELLADPTVHQNTKAYFTTKD